MSELTYAEAWAEYVAAFQDPLLQEKVKQEYDEAMIAIELSGRMTVKDYVRNYRKRPIISRLQRKYLSGK